MITIREDQLIKISATLESVFLTRVNALLNIEQFEFWEILSDEEKEKFLTRMLRKAKKMSLVVEKDIYDYIVLNLKYGEDFYLRKYLVIENEWLHSEHVPGWIKIQKLSGLIQAKISKTEL